MVEEEAVILVSCWSHKLGKVLSPRRIELQKMEERKKIVHLYTREKIILRQSLQSIHRVSTERKFVTLCIDVCALIVTIWLF